MTNATATAIVDELQAALDLAVAERRAAKAAGNDRRIALANRAWSFALAAVCNARADAKAAAVANLDRPDAKPVPTFHRH